jgi:hypothetical protein
MAKEAAMANWTAEEIAERFAEAARTAHRLPSVRVQGYFNNWPPIMRTEFERLASEDTPPRRYPPNPKEIERMLQTMQWTLWLEVDARHLLWMRANGDPWPHIVKRFALHRSTLWRWRDRSLEHIAQQLNAGVDCRQKHSRNPMPERQ